MADPEFEWDEAKNLKNQQKHKVSFEEAKTIFNDKHATQFYDPDHSANENRFILLGINTKLNVLVVCHCFKENETVIRIISARKADKEEQNHYWSKR